MNNLCSDFVFEPFFYLLSSSAQADRSPEHENIDLPFSFELLAVYGSSPIIATSSSLPRSLSNANAN
jgi:hypothetical protein